MFFHLLISWIPEAFQFPCEMGNKQCNGDASGEEQNGVNSALIITSTSANAIKYLTFWKFAFISEALH